MMDYAEFLARKAQTATQDGFAPIGLPSFLFDFQAHMVDWSLRQGRGAIFADCGLGKTPMQLVWADQVVRHTNGRVLILTPLAVAEQTSREAVKFDIEAHVAQCGQLRSGISITNYEKLHLFDPADYVGMVCDESAILKSFDGARRKQITDFMRKMRYRLLCTATPSPNEFTELGTSSEALGYLGHMDMLSRFFKNEQGNSIKAFRSALRPDRNDARVLESGQWRFKGHAEQPFWRWVCSWARAIRKPSDLGFDDARFILPPLIERQHLVEVASLPDGRLFAVPAIGLAEQRDERRRSIVERCEKAAALVNDTGKPFIVWCHLNPEGDLLEKLIPDAVQVSGADSDDAKVEKFMAFVEGRVRGLITKEKIGAWGLNFQHCAHTVGFPTHSFEGYYQRVRRSWRFGQTQPVVSDIVTTEGERSVLANLQRKSQAADRMFANLVAHMNNAIGVDRSLQFKMEEEIPQWL